MKRFNLVFLFALLLSSIACIRRDRENENRDPFQQTILWTKQVNGKARALGSIFYKDNVEKGNKKGIPVADFEKSFREIFGDLSKVGPNPFVYAFDLDNDGFISKEESSLAFRNAIVTIGGHLVLGNKYEIPAGKYQEKVQEAVAFTVDKYQKVGNFVNNLFDKADENKNGKLSTKKFLETFQFASTPNVQKILESQNPGGAENITKQQAFNIFALLALDTEKAEQSEDNSRPGKGKAKGPAPIENLAGFFGDE